MVQAAAFVFEHATYDLDSRGAQNGDAAPAHRRIRIDASDHHPPHSRLHQRARTWRRASLMRAWLERHVSRRAARLRTRAGERHGLGMWTAAGGGRSLADDLSTALAAAHDHTSHGRVGRGPPEHPARERERLAHVA